MATVDVIVKVGDQADASTGILDGMPVCYVDVDEWGYQPVYSDHMRKVYAILRIDKTWLGAVQNVLKPYTKASDSDAMNVDGSITRLRKAFIDLAALETSLGIPSLEAALRGKGSVDVLDCTGLTAAVLKDAKNYTGSGHSDHNAVSSGSYNIGSGYDYTTVSAAYADVAALTGDLTFTQKAGTTEVSRPYTTAASNGYTFKHTSDIDPLGDPTNTSRLISIGHDGFGLSPDLTGSGAVTLEKLYVKNTVTLNSAYHAVSLGSTALTGTMSVLNCMVDKGAQQGGGITAGNSSASLRMVNCVVWDQSANQGGIFFWSPKANDTYVENCVAYGCYRGFYHNVAFATELRNCAAFNSLSGSDYGNTSSSVGRNNCSSDATATNANWSTGTGNITSKTAATSVTSTTDTDSSFLDVLVGGNLDGAGTTPYQTRTNCIRGRLAPGPRGTSIGASEPTRITAISNVHRRRV